jgi:hypothetical protein
LRTLFQERNDKPKSRREIINMRLISLRLLNFKGIGDFTFIPDGQDASVYGDNAVGKTTLEDGFNWLLFGKDSAGKADFAIKTLDANNKAIPGLDHEVEGVFEINGRRLMLKKVYKEVWTKKRGSVSKVFSGHEVNHFIDGVPVQKKEYDACITGIAPEETFKLLTSPSYFNEQLHWSERRKILLAVCGDLADAEVIASDKKLAKLPDILQGRKLEDHRKVIAARKAEINKELDKIPTRIDEANRAMPTLPTRDAEELNLLAANYRAKKEEKQQEQARIISGGEIAEKKRQLAEVDSEILHIKIDDQGQADASIREARVHLNNALSRIDILQAELTSAKRRMDAITVDADRVESSIKQMRERWHQVNEERSEYYGETSCPTCGQDLPDGMIETAKEKALANFNQDKAVRLERINNEGLRYKANLESLVDEHSDLVAKVNDREKQLQAEEAVSARIQVKIDALATQQQPITENPTYTKKLKEREQLEKDIEKLNTGNQEALEQVRNQIANLDIVLRELDDDTDKIRRRKDGQKRIQELSEQEKTLSAEFEKLEGELFLTELFVKTKVSLLESRINSKFKYARFKMFDQQINGGITECCEVLYGGVPYGSGLNAGHRIIVGMDIIRTLSEHYGFEAPIFVDNAESVTTLPEMNAQVIRLIKPEITEKNRAEYSKLVIETESKKEYREAV